jgi:hypothetical protein
VRWLLVIAMVAAGSMAAAGAEHALPAEDPRGYVVVEAEQALAANGDAVHPVRIADCDADTVSDDICVYAPMDRNHLAEVAVPAAIDLALWGSVSVDTSVEYPAVQAAYRHADGAIVATAVTSTTLTVGVVENGSTSAYSVQHGCQDDLRRPQGDFAIDLSESVVWIVCFGNVVRVDFEQGVASDLGVTADVVLARPDGGALAITATGAAVVSEAGDVLDTTSFEIADGAAVSAVAGHPLGGAAIITDRACASFCTLDPASPPEYREIDRFHHAARLHWTGALDQGFEVAYAGSSSSAAGPPMTAVDEAGRVFVVLPERLASDLSIEADEAVVLFSAGGESPVDGVGPNWSGEYTQDLLFAWEGIVQAHSIDGDSAIGRFAIDPFGTFMDDDGSPFSGEVESLAAAGITTGCHDSGVLFCPTDVVSRGQMASFLARFLGLPPGLPDVFLDDQGSTHEPAINALAAAGITDGCDAADPTRFCPAEPLSRGQMAAMLARALELAPGPDRFDDDDGTIHEASIDALAAAGITNGCDATDAGRFCPTDPIRRDQMAALLARSSD